MAEVAVLLVSELVTNALIHARTASVLTLTRRPGRLRVELRDASTEPATVPNASENGHREGGRGVLLISSMADLWGNDVDEHGKTVWFELVVPPHSSEPRRPMSAP